MKKTYIAQLVGAALGTLAAASAHASAFQLLENSAVISGNAGAGTAAAAEDASTAFYNPAAMVFMKNRNQISASIDVVKPTAKFKNNGSTLPAATTPANQGGEGGDAGDWTPVPGLNATWGLSDRFSMGLAIGAPFGLKTEYDKGWMGRYQADVSDVQSIDINPSFAWKVTDSFAIGGGVSYQHFSAELSQAVNFGALVGGACPSVASAAVCQGAAAAGAFTNKEGHSTVSGDSNEWGWNLGLAWQVSQTTRVGLAYRSSIEHTVEGDVTFDRPSFGATFDPAVAALTPNGPARVTIKLPDTWTLSAFQQIDEKWSIQGDIARTGWSSIKTLDIYRTNGTLLASSYYNWKDTWRVALGGAYQYSDALKLRAGVAYDQSPVDDEHRTPRLPDNDRTWLSFGMNYAFTKALSMDFGYTHIFVKNAPINDSGYHADYNPGGINTTNPVVRGTVKGEYENSVDILSAQLNYYF